VVHPLAPLTLGDLELKVLEQLWQLGSGDVRAVHLALRGDRDNHSNTIQSALERLFRKGILDREKHSHAYIYSPRLKREELVARLIDETLQRVKGTESMPMLAAFVDLAVAQDPAVLDELEAADDRFAPSRLPILVRGLLLRGPPAEPLDVGV